MTQREIIKIMLAAASTNLLIKSSRLILLTQQKGQTDPSQPLICTLILQYHRLASRSRFLLSRARSHRYRPSPPENILFHLRAHTREKRKKEKNQLVRRVREQNSRRMVKGPVNTRAREWVPLLRTRRALEYYKSRAGPRPRGQSRTRHGYLRAIFLAATAPAGHWGPGLRTAEG